jgi:ubiquinone biosynthesis protein
MIPTFLRLLRVGWTLARYDVIIPREFVSRLPPAGKWIGRLARIGSPPMSGDTGSRMAAALERLGPAWIKFGQFLATRPDIIGVQTAQGLARLKDALAPFPRAQALEALVEAFGEADAQRLFGDLPEEPVAAASIAQVYRHTLPDGRDVAVKILRPGVERAIAEEGKVLGLLSWFAENLDKDGKRLRPTAFTATIQEALRKELDLRREAGAGDAFGEIAAFDGYLKAPVIDWDRTARRVLTTSWVEGTPMTAPGVLDTIDRKDFANRITCGFLAAALDHGMFHADMHEGNLIAGSDGELWAIDFGIMGRIGPNEQRYLAEILYGFIRRDYRRCAEVHIEAGYVPADRDVGEFAHALRAIGEPIWGRPASQVSMGRVLLQLLDTTEQFGMALRPELVLLQKTMVQVEGVARAIDPEHDIWSASRPVVERFVRRELGPEGQARRALADIRTGLDSLRRLPGVLDRLEAALKRQGPGESGTH